jgi:hypothetical protein
MNDMKYFFVMEEFPDMPIAFPAAVLLLLFKFLYIMLISVSFGGDPS